MTHVLPVRSVGVMGDGRTYEQVGHREERENEMK